ncbi:PQQ-binding-like beta-propeller repeat protein [Halomicroarcula sp. F13]|uniref:PQQ-binding-like beta-propeller repeat protein n=1 Tax=Haloarcula rubra TaxID=2487747 RepID=A0AAW4PTM0_9EURY|nr:PQQ-binding-like beta-propeller repeat protein [Halomicroarcula rubra]MBX0323504.1 PQQ-binding-like beta-propeller repeat protein [Halomicroarcula rubra]
MPSRRAFLALAATTGVAGCLTDGSQNPTTDDPATGSSNSTDESATPTDETDRYASADHVAWTRSLRAPVVTTPTPAGDSVYVGTEDGTVAALSPSNGTEQWTYDAERTVQNAPVLAGETVLTVAGAEGLNAAHTLHAIDADSGERRWTFSPTDWWLDVVGADGDTAFVATADDHVQSSGQTLYALSLADGTEQWAVEIGDPRGGLITDERVYVPAYGRLYAFERDGTVAWEYSIPEYQYRTLSVVGDTVALVSAEDPRQPTVHGIDAEAGERRWTFEEWNAYTTQAVGDQLLVAGDSVASLDPATGEVRWSADVSATVYDAPVADGTLYVVNEEAAAISLSDGQVAWQTPVDAYLARPSGLLDGQLVIQRSASEDDRDRHVLALDADTGETAWSFAAESRLTRLSVGDSHAFAGEDETVLAVTP